MKRGGRRRKTAGEEGGGGGIGNEREVHYQPLVIENAFHICLQRFAFGLSLLILLTSDMLHVGQYPNQFIPL